MNTLKMDPLLKSSLKTQFEMFRQKFLNASTEDIKTWIRTKKRNACDFVFYKKIAISAFVGNGVGGLCTKFCGNNSILG